LPLPKLQDGRSNKHSLAGERRYVYANLDENNFLKEISLDEFDTPLENVMPQVFFDAGSIEGYAAKMLTR
jgi:hypothetical protein